MVEDAAITAFALVAATATGLGLSGVLSLALHALRIRRLRAGGRRVYGAFASVLLLEGLAFGYGLAIEPRWLDVTFVRLETASLAPGQRVRVVHLTDLHADGTDPALDAVVERVNALAPDALIVTGDMLNARDGVAAVGETLGRIRAPLGRYGVRGNQDLWYWADVDVFGGAAVELAGSPARLHGVPVTVCGAAYEDERAVRRCLLQAPEGVRIVAYHTPDLVEDLAPLGPDLYLAGHTHGGQVRVPLYGALATMSRFGKRYEMGRYDVGGTLLYVNRGIGMEGPPAPAVRFLCRPEIAVIDLVGAPKR